MAKRKVNGKDKNNTNKSEKIMPDPKPSDRPDKGGKDNGGKDKDRGSGGVRGKGSGGGVRG